LGPPFRVERLLVHLSRTGRRPALRADVGAQSV
jgi:hypothetical protein